MGTRAMISIDGKPMLATHWDGYPESLGVELSKTKSLDRVISIAEKHSVNSAHPLLLNRTNKDMIKKFKGKAGYSWIKNKFVDDIKYYGDYAEYEYNFSNGKWFVRKLSGEWNKKQAGKWIPLKEEVKRLELEAEKEKLKQVV